MKELITSSIAASESGRTVGELVNELGKSDSTIRKNVTELLATGAIVELGVSAAGSKTYGLGKPKGIGSSVKATERDNLIVGILRDNGDLPLADIVQTSGIKLSLVYASLWRLCKLGRAVKVNTGTRTPVYSVQVQV